MTFANNSVAPFYDGWNVYHQHLVRAIAPLTADQLELRAAPQLRSVYMIVTHIIGARARWTHHVLGLGDGTLLPYAVWDRPGQPTRSAVELTQALQATWQVLEAGLGQWTAEDLAVELSDTDDDGTVETFTRQWVIWHLIEHDLHHGGELSFLLGMHSIPAIDL